MLELSAPPMPHAVGVDQHFQHLSLRTKLAASSVASQRPSLPQSGLPPLVTNSYPAARRQSSNASAMNVVRAAVGVPHSSADAASYGGSMMPDSSQAMQQFPNGIGKSYQLAASEVPMASQRANTLVGQQLTPTGSHSNAASVQSVHRRKQSTSAVAPALQLPKAVEAPQASVPQLAAEITCLFWFESSTLLQQIEESARGALHSVPLAADASPTSGFRKWVATILSTTQVAQNVILLALLFIYRLKKSNPSVKGKPGSEYRLLTVALMLGNKFLDDNTYTNKTWAEVSGIAVQEVHIMEVEFLSNMRYSLFTSEAEWKDWETFLGKFGTFLGQASRALDMRMAGPQTPTTQKPSALPSPPISTNAPSPFVASYSPGHAIAANTPHILPQVVSAAPSPIGPLPEPDSAAFAYRKRSFDGNALEPPAKRVATTVAHLHPQNLATAPGTLSARHVPGHGTRLPPPHLPSLTIPASMGSAATPLSAKLPMPAPRAMSMVFPPPVNFSQPPISTPLAHAIAVSHASGMSISTPTRQISPFPVGNSSSSSPTNQSFGQSSGNLPQPPSGLSPSFHLGMRNSPYRPVRRVQTLLVPPPSASVQSAPRSVHQNQMQYQPLGRPIQERKAGPLPYMRNPWPNGNQHQYQQYSNTPSQPWPELPPIQQTPYSRP